VVQRRLMYFVAVDFALIFVLLIFIQHPFRGGIMSPFATFVLLAPGPFLMYSMQPKRGSPGPTIEIAPQGVSVHAKTPRIAAWTELDLARATIAERKITLRYRKDVKDPIVIWRKCYDAELGRLIAERVEGAASRT